MPLDNAQFIAEFSLTDPPGTDPVAEGDNHIRQVKIAVQQSFAFIDAAVTKTSAQLNDVAQLSEANAFTEANSFAAATTFAALGTFNANLRFANDADRGLQWADATGVTFKWELLVLQGSNDDIKLTRYVAGVSTDSPWSVSAATGIVDFAHVPTVEGAPIWIAGELRLFAISATLGTNWFLADGTNGTGNFTDRALIASGISNPGDGLTANLVGSAVAQAVSATALSSAQMPSHRHRIRSGGASGITDVALGNVSNQTVVGANRGNTSSSMFDTNSGGQQFIENTGSGSTHSHTASSSAVTENGTGREIVRPFSRVVQMFQYVP